MKIEKINLSRANLCSPCPSGGCDFCGWCDYCKGGSPILAVAEWYFGYPTAEELRQGFMLREV